MTEPDSRAELPSCPFCGEHDGVIVVKNDPGYPHFATLYLVRCNQCAVQTTRFTSRAEAIAAWTRRTLPQGFAAGIEAAAKDADEWASFIAQCGTGPNDTPHEIKRAAAQAFRDHAAKVRSLIPSPDAGVVESRDDRQARTAAWCAAAFGSDHAASIPQRGIRMLEEAIELAQACGCELEMCRKLLEFVYSRPVGEVKQELGGLGLTALALAAAAGTSADDAEKAELARVMAKSLAHFHARNQAKNDAGFNVVSPAYPLAALRTIGETNPAPPTLSREDEGEK